MKKVNPKNPQTDYVDENLAEDIKLDLKSNTNLTNSKVDKLESKMYNDFDLFRNQRHQY